MSEYYVYILSNKSYTLYVGVTNNLIRRVYEHKKKLIKGFTYTYNVTELVYFEQIADIQSAIAREKKLKGWSREKKVNLIQTVNPKWDDLSVGWYDEGAFQ